MFDPELIETEDGRNQLAQKIAETLDTDSTEPVPDKDNWIGEKTLRDFESVVVQTRRLYGPFSEVCQKAHTLATNPNAQVLLELGRINGLRRLPEGERPDDLIRDLIEKSRANVESLEDSPTKNRLLSLWAYHAGIYASVIGDYSLAAQSQERSAVLAEKSGDTKTAAISRLRAGVERVNEALVNNPERVGDALGQMYEAANALYALMKDMTDDRTAVRWAYSNMPIHNLTSHFWAGGPYDGSADYGLLQKLRDLDPELADTHRATIAVAFAIHELNTGDKKKASKLATEVIQDRLGPRPSPQYFATAHLILAIIAQVFGDAEEAERQLRAAIAIEGEAHQVRAIARRALGL